MGLVAQWSEQSTHNALVAGSSPAKPIALTMDKIAHTIGGPMDNTTETKTLTAVQYFMSRKKDMERYIEGEHAWYGDVDQSVQFNARPWYLKDDTVSKIT